jgi:hypothetical protein
MGHVWWNFAISRVMASVLGGEEAIWGRGGCKNEVRLQKSGRV